MAGMGVLLYAPRILLKLLFWTILSLLILEGIIMDPFVCTAQICAPYAIIGRTIAVYNSLERCTDGPHIDAQIRVIASRATVPLVTALSIWSFHDKDGSNQTPSTRSEGTSSASWPSIWTVALRSSEVFRCLVKCISWYFSGANLALNLRAYITHFSCAYMSF